jgi:hypothetical protein
LATQAGWPLGLSVPGGKASESVVWAGAGPATQAQRAAASQNFCQKRPKPVHLLNVFMLKIKELQKSQCASDQKKRAYLLCFSTK